MRMWFALQWYVHSAYIMTEIATQPIIRQGPYGEKCTVQDVPTTENMAALIFPTCNPPVRQCHAPIIHEPDERWVLQSMNGKQNGNTTYSVPKVEQSDGETTEDDREVEP